MSEAAGEAAYGVGMPKSPLHPQPQPIVDDAHEERGRPRKNTPDGTKLPAIFPAPYPIGLVASPTPALPPGFTLGLWGVGVVRPQAPPALPSPLPPPPPFENSKQRAKKKRVWPPSSHTSKKQRELAVAGCSSESHVLLWNGWAVFIMSAEGAVRNVTLKQPASSCGTVIMRVILTLSLCPGVYVPSKVVIGRFAADEKEEIKQDVASGRVAADEKEEIKQDVASGTPGATTPTAGPNEPLAVQEAHQTRARLAHSTAASYFQMPVSLKS
ncbi:hypothetical protein D1007_47661 [Hordeum vulgare]|nr:hypothetical protein D1007_47661 [Hordeum vulgare]